jgi:hypothetical protein
MTRLEGASRRSGLAPAPSLCDDRSDMADASLIGVVVGGALTLSGQVVLEALKRHRDQADARVTARAAARLQRDDVASALEAARWALCKRTWWPVGLDLPLSTEMQDRRLLASHLSETEFRRVSGSLRRFAQLRSERKAAVDHGGVQADCIPLSGDAYERTVLAFLDVAAARLALAPLAGYGVDPWPQEVPLEAKLEKRAREQLGLSLASGLFKGDKYHAPNV